MPRMIGLHHHMSYSPASASQSRLGSDNDNNIKINKSKSADRNNIQSRISNTSDSNNNNSNNNRSQNQKQQQFVLTELADDSIRALRVHKIRDERFDARMANHHTDIVQVSAETVMPTIVVESVPKSRPASGTRSHRHHQHHQQQQQQTSGRGAPHDATAGSELREGRRRDESNHRLQSYRNEPTRGGEDQQRHFLLNEQHRREHQSNQVVLIMSDTSSLAGANCVPIIGRRLPSKSFDHSTGGSASAGPGIIEVAHHHQPTMIAPVVGRRSHRLSDQHQQQTEAHLYRVAVRDELVQSRNSARRGQQAVGVLDIVETQTAPTERVQMTGIPWLEPPLAAGSVRPTSSRPVAPMKIKNKNDKLASKKSITSSNSCSSLAKYANATSQLLQQQHHRGSFVPDVVTSSELCLDACCRGQQPVALTPTTPNHMTLAPEGGYGGGLPLEGDPLGLCMMPCCRLGELDAGNPLANYCPSKSSSIRSSSSSSQQQHQMRRARERARAPGHGDSSAATTAGPNHTTCQANGPMAAMTSSSRQQQVYRRTSASMARRSSSLCRSDEHLGLASGAPPVDQYRRLSRRAAATAAGASPLLATAPGHYPMDTWVHQQQHQAPPLVPSKPVSYKHTSSHHRRRELLKQHHLEQLQQLEQEQESSSAVTQMYESLAAELKAKLGNPNRAPILLPPKDYDTLSRKQGKLSGIELRRSTNPQLVGPTVARVSSAATVSCGGGQQATISEEEPTTISCCDHTTTTSTGSRSSSGHATATTTTTDSSASSSSSSSPKIPAGSTSTTSSGRNSRELDQGSQYDNDHHHHHHQQHHLHHLRRDNSLQRSRSNSSSGLGSISIGASSPDQNARSSPSQQSSGSETDMTTTMRHLQEGDDSHSKDDGRSSTLLQATLANDEFIMFGSSMKTRTTTTPASKSRSDSGAGAKQAPGDESSPSAIMQSATVRGSRETENNQTTSAKPIRTDGHLWNGRVEVPLKVNNDRRNGNTYLATKQIIY